MRDSFDPRILSTELVELLRACQGLAPVTLGGGVALSAGHLGHRLSRDIDLICRQRKELRLLVRLLPQAAEQAGVRVVLLRDAGTFVRAGIDHSGGSVDLDLVWEATQPIEPPDTIEGVWLESLPDLRAAKLTCLLARSEPRDLVDLLFLDRSGFPPDLDLHLALLKDAGIDPGVLAWLLEDFPLRPLPMMLEPLDEHELKRFREELRERLRRQALP